MKIGFIGLGNMGGPMARRLLEAGNDVRVFDLNEGRMAELATVGAKTARSGPELAARVDILFTSLPGPRQSAAAMPVLIGQLSAGGVWVDLTTNDRHLVKDLGEAAAERGVAALEAPVTGAVDGARLGKLTIFVGGEPETLERVRPLLDILGRVIHCGPIGTGNVAKLITNQIWFINAAAIGEGLVMGKKAGVDLLVLWEALKNSVGDTFVVRHDVPSIFDGHYDPSFSLDLCCKDLDLIKALAEETETPVDITLLARDKFESARERYGGDQAELLVCKLVEEAAGVELRAEGEWVKHWEV